MSTYVLEELPVRPPTLARFVRETMLLVGRSLRTIPRVPERLSDVTIQPVIFTLLFLYVFGSAIHIPGMRYQDYLLPGLLGQGLAFAIIGSGVATATDFSTGVVDRFRSLPVTRLSVITAQVIGQVLEQILGMVIVGGIGIALGWRPDFTVLGFFGFLGLMLLGLFTFVWLGVMFGMLVRNADAMQGLGFALVFPLSFLAGTFVPIEGMKLIPRVIGEWDPIAAFVAAVRHVSQGTTAHGSWPLEHPIEAMLLWCVAIIAVCIPVTTYRLKKMTTA
jgi:ABC transporter DrrB family efflux protein